MTIESDSASAPSEESANTSELDEDASPVDAPHSDDETPRADISQQTEPEETASEPDVPPDIGEAADTQDAQQDEAVAIDALSLEDKPKIVSRRTAILKWGFVSAAGLSAGTYGYGTVVEPHHPVLETIKIPIKGLPASLIGLKIVQLSDLHVQPGFPASDLLPAIRLAQNVGPDIILITGDYVNDDVEDGQRYMRLCAQRLAELKAPLGVFASFGNHDFPPPPADPSPEPWIAAGIRPLLDEVVKIQRGGESFYLIGLRSFIKRPVSPRDVLQIAPANSLRIVMWHEPDRARECAVAGASVQLSGHTHGGQVVLPLIGPPVLPAGGKLYPAGLYWVDGMPLYVTRGVGLLSPRIRLNCPPEVTLITLARA